ncbi:YdcH family protein [Dichelobacter nodosus]|uniref:DUF465 domain-containing protein n=1 Tax=Dichelobacter nodosus (strain VCS1703A) TaxID=246195 RepID=A5EXN4_DICNV|nr:DUF465 domain-containing protein [Dichelobacter nodosus]ABQ13983.1 conserved hypothetical protein [Dichelobacter nodosus VCS1703A]AXM45883.1 DUF465 domain-containing protein [Dichelobacter nodosus]KNZ39049.1 hypothetical protein AKG33_04645 [Dichelobacter nodosus]
MFDEYRDLIETLKNNDNHFARLFNEHSALDAEITRLINTSTATLQHDEIEQKKRRKLQLKDEIYKILKEHADN